MACGAIAFVNILKWLGWDNVTYKMVVDLRDAGIWCKEDGMTRDRFRNLLKIHDVPYKLKSGKVEYISRALRNGHLVCIEVGDEEYAHQFLIDGESDCFFHTINYSNDSRKIRKDLLQKIIRGKIIVITK